MSRPANDSYWMVRTQDMRIFRPIPKAELIEKIAAGVIAPNDELCAGNGYWFMLSEVNEVREHLGDIDLSCLHSKDKGAHTSSTDTRPIQKTSIIPPKVTLENQPAGTPPVQAAPKKKREVKPAVEAAPAIPRIQETVNSEIHPHRARNAVGVAFVLIAFIVVLALFWMGSY
jgi:hypothetical protein